MTAARCCTSLLCLFVSLWLLSRLPLGSLQVRAAGNQGSGVLRSMVQGNGLIVLHHAQGDVQAGEEVDVMMFDGVI